MRHEQDASCGVSRLPVVMSAGSEVWSVSADSEVGCEQWVVGGVCGCGRSSAYGASCGFLQGSGGPGVEFGGELIPFGVSIFLLLCTLSFLSVREIVDSRGITALLAKDSFSHPLSVLPSCS